MGFPPCKDAPESLPLGRDSTPDCQQRGEWLRDWESLGGVCLRPLDLGFPNRPPTLNFLGDGFPSVLGPPRSLSGPAVSLNGVTLVLSTLI